MGMMLESFEKYLSGLQKGDKFSFTLVPEEAYGLFEQDHIIELPKNIFEVDGKFDNERITEGQILPMEDTSGNRLNGAVVKIKDDVVVLDFNHPLAGETLHFEGEILDVHDPSPEEIAAFTSEGCCSDCDNEHNNEGCNCCCH
jgi:FKBP-type peptidyl-prolyl cis-trans isomerase SlyD